MLNEHGTLSHYFTNFTMYTLCAVGMIYAAFWYNRQQVAKKQAEQEAQSAADSAASSPPPAGLSASGNDLEVESVLPMESSQTVYVLRAGRERFLVASSGDKISLLSRLDNVPTPASIAAELKVASTVGTSPWFTAPRPQAPPPPAPATFSERLMESIRWLATTRK